jgi:uncharacterized protein YvpB
MSSGYSRLILSVPHLMQRNIGECLVGCVGMALTYTGRSFSYQRVTKLLNVHPGGAYFSNVRNLETLGVSVVLNHGGIDQLFAHLQQDRPIIVPVKTGELSYWCNHPLQFENTSHAIVVIGIDAEQIYVNDPALLQAPVFVSHGDFELARIEYDELYAVLN